MCDHQSARWVKHGDMPRARLMLIMLLAALSLAGCAATSANSSPTGTPGTATHPPPPAATSTSGATSIPVKVFFSKHPETDSNVTAVFAVSRVSPTVAVGTFAIQQLILGPTPSETASGYFTELTASLGGASNCGGPDFTYTVDNGAHSGTLRFCRPTTLPGDLSGGRIKAEITATLTQFPNVTKVIILNDTGHCFDDLSGGDLCLH
ncbi:MAG TPA: hypothetical protein VIG30_12660 [Ktedonobacterales bacterium]|jgi:hypothetical protein